MALTTARATVAVSPFYGSNMVLQRDKPVPVWGTASPNKTVTVSYNSQIVATTSDAQGRWRGDTGPHERQSRRQQPHHHRSRRQHDHPLQRRGR